MFKEAFGLKALVTSLAVSVYFIALKALRNGLVAYFYPAYLSEHQCTWHSARIMHTVYKLCTSTCTMHVVPCFSPCTCTYTYIIMYIQRPFVAAPWSFCQCCRSRDGSGAYCSRGLGLGLPPPPPPRKSLGLGRCWTRFRSRSWSRMPWSRSWTFRSRLQHCLL